jgi:hypothetical protein
MADTTCNHELEFIIGSEFDQCRRCGGYFPTIHGRSVEPVRRYTETVKVMRGLYSVRVRENRPAGTEKHRTIAHRVTRTKRQAEATAVQLWRQFNDPRIPAES